ncbi:MAG: hypothetical protein HY298_25660 [Verrucomicrobia bacterium]|nr:hypothetical protein [Verrucomicrobiota bacterium]
MKPPKFVKLSLIVSGFLSLVCTCPAAQIAFEDFNYSISSTLSNQNGGTGWLSPWLGANIGGGGNEANELDFVITNGYSWSNSTGGYIVGTGGAIFDHDSSPHGEFRQWFSPGTALGFGTTYGTNIWFSFIATYDVASGSGCAVLPFEALGDSLTGFGVTCLGPAGGGDFQVQLRVGAFGQAPGPLLGTQASDLRNLAACRPGTNLVVGRFQLDPTGPGGAAPPFTGNDRLDVWLNPNAEPTTGSQLWYSGFYAYRDATVSSGYTGIRTGGGGQMTIDEFRIGTNYSDVIPSTANSPAQIPSPPLLSIENAGPAGVQFNLSEGTPTNSNEIVTYYTTNSGGAPVAIDATWVGKTPASYSFTIAKPPANGPTNFTAYTWLIPNPNGHIQALDNPNAVQLAIISDGQGGAKAVLGYFVNSGGTLYDNINTIFTTGVIATLSNAPFAGTWTLRANSDTSFTIIAPNNVQASGSLQSGDEGNFASSVSFFLGVNPNGGPNVGNPALGYYMTVSGVIITNNSGVTINPSWGPGVVVQSDFGTGAPFSAQNPPNWSVLANFPSCIYVMPSNSLYRATWGNACGTSSGANSLTTTNALGGSGAWTTVVPTTSLLSDSTNIAFITTKYTTNSAAYFRVSVPYVP